MSDRIPLDLVKDARAAEFTGQIDRDSAIADIRRELNVTRHKAEFLLDAPLPLVERDPAVRAPLPKRLGEETGPIRRDYFAARHRSERRASSWLPVTLLALLTFVVVLLAALVTRGSQ